VNRKRTSPAEEAHVHRARGDRQRGVQCVVQSIGCRRQSRMRSRAPALRWSSAWLWGNARSRTATEDRLAGWSRSPPPPGSRGRESTGPQGTRPAHAWTRGRELRRCPCRYRSLGRVPRLVRRAARTAQQPPAAPGGIA